MEGRQREREQLGKIKEIELLEETKTNKQPGQTTTTTTTITTTTKNT